MVINPRIVLDEEDVLRLARYFSKHRGVKDVKEMQDYDILSLVNDILEEGRRLFEDPH